MSEGLDADKARFLAWLKRQNFDVVREAEMMHEYDKVTVYEKESGITIQRVWHLAEEEE
jgi:hypothetical protein